MAIYYHGTYLNSGLFRNTFGTLHVSLCSFTAAAEQGEIPKNVFMVFEYLEYDLTGILETPEIRLTQDHVKSWSQQLLQGTHYMQ